jgi:hypothetical protein
MNRNVRVLARLQITRHSFSIGERELMPNHDAAPPFALHLGIGSDRLQIIVGRLRMRAFDLIHRERNVERVRSENPEQLEAVREVLPIRNVKRVRRAPQDRRLEIRTDMTRAVRLSPLEEDLEHATKARFACRQIREKIGD